MDVLKTMVALVRTKVKDLSVRQFYEHEIILALNEGKNELVKTIRQASENYFEATASGTISAVTVPNYSTITLPTDFIELRNITITTSGKEDIKFVRMNQSDDRFKYALMDGGNFASGAGAFYYDFMGMNTMILAPGSDQELTYSLDYIRMVNDMLLPDDYPAGIPPEHYDFIVTWAIAECLRAQGDKRLPLYESKLEYQRNTVIASVNTRQRKDPEFVTGYMESEGWG
jgi:hypothetical protein